MYNPAEQEMDAELAEKFEVAIKTGIRLGQMELNRRRKQFRRRFGGTVALCFLFFSCLFAIRISPVFAAFIREIPGLEKFVNLISSTSDKGIQLAVDNDFIQPVGVSDEHDGMKLTVQGILADDNRMVVFYDIQISSKVESVQFDKPRLSDASGKELPAMISYSYPEEAKQDIRKTGIQRGIADFQLSPGTTLSDEVLLKVRLKRSALPNPSNAPKEMIAGEWDIPVTGASGGGGTEFALKIPIDRARFAGLQHEVAIGQTIHIEGQSVSFSKAVVSPLRISLYMDYGMDNTKQIFGAGDIRLVDDKGTVWRNNSSMSMVKDHLVYHFESPYFNEPKSLTIEGSWFRALDKNLTSVVVDTEKGQLLQVPDAKLNLYHVANNDEYSKLDFVLSGLDQADNMMYSLFDGVFTDAAGNSYKTADLHEVISGYVDGSKPGEQHSMYYIENKPYKQPLTLTINNYPAYIRQPYKIRIK